MVDNEITPNQRIVPYGDFCRKLHSVITEKTAIHMVRKNMIDSIIER